MSTAFLYGNGGGGTSAALNFKVVGGAIQPENPKENTIWVQTSISLTTVEFSDQQALPSWAMPAGFCYISIDGGYWSSDYDARPAFGLVYKEKLIVYVEPKAAYLNTDGTASGWARVNAYIYKSGAWVQFSSVFAATIRITYPAGSGSHVEGPNGYYAQSPDTSGYWEVTVPAAGDYLACADDSTTGQGAWKAVSITEDGQSVDVTLSYELVIYNNGSVNTDDTGGGFEVTHMPYNNVAGAASSHRLTYNKDYINFSSNGSGTAYLHTKSPIDFTAYNTLHFKVKRGAGAYSQAFVAANPTKPSSSVYIANDASVFSNIGSNSDSDYTDIDFDISSISGEQYVGMGFYVNGNSAYVYCKEIKLT